MTTTKNDNLKSKLTKLRANIKKLNEESINFLLEQSEILMYNENLEKESKKSLPDGKTSNKTTNQIKISTTDKKNFTFNVNGNNKIMNLKEMQEFVKICQTSDNQKIYNWFKRERSDFLKDFAITNKNHKVINLIGDTIRKSYKTKK